MGILKWFWNHKRISLVVIIIATVGIWWQFFRGNGEELDEAVVQRGVVIEELILTGEIIADEHVFLKFPVSGKISYVGAREGDVVKKGKLLGKLNTISLNSTYQRARADLRAADANVDEVHDDVKDNDDDETFAIKNTRTAAEVAKDKAWENFKIAEYNLNNSSLYAPFDGHVVNVAHPFAGINILATENMFEILNPETMYFSVSADQTEVGSITEGQKVKIILDAHSEEELVGTVSFVAFAPIQGEIGAVYSIKVVFDEIRDNGFKYRIGMTGDAKFEISRNTNVFYVPNTFVQSKRGEDNLLINNGNDEIKIKVGLEGEERVEISGDGVSEGLAVYD